jgi:hypothetical protein
MPIDLLPVICPVLVAWNKGRFVGQKCRSCCGTSAPLGSGLKWQKIRATWHCSTWQSTASGAGATLSHYVSETSLLLGVSRSALR